MWKARRHIGTEARRGIQEGNILLFHLVPSCLHAFVPLPVYYPHAPKARRRSGLHRLGIWFGGSGALFLFVTRLFNQDRPTALKAAPILFLVFERYQLLLAAAALVGTVVWRIVGASARVTVLFGLLAAAAFPRRSARCSSPPAWSNSACKANPLLNNSKNCTGFR